MSALFFLWQQSTVDARLLSSILLVVFALLLIFAMILGYFLWRRHNSRQRLYERIAELEALGNAGRAIVAANLDVEELCALIAGEVSHIIPTLTFQIGLFRDEFYDIVFWRINGIRQPARRFDLTENSGLVGYVRDSKEPLLIRDFEQELADLPAQPRYVSDKPPRSAAFLPLISGDAVIGVMAAQSSEPARFAEADLRLLSILANQTAVAIENAQLFKREKMRAARLELVGQVAREVNGLIDLDEIFHRVVTLTQATFGYHPVSIGQIDFESGEAILQASTLTDLTPGEHLIEFGSGLVGAALAEQETIVVNDVADDRRYNEALPGLPESATASTRAEIAIPLRTQAEIVGVLDVQSDQADVFTPDEVRVLEALAAQVAIAIQNARLFARQREQAWLTSAQLQVVDTIARSHSLDELLESTTLLTLMLVGLDCCAVLLWDREELAYRGGHIAGKAAMNVTDFRELSMPIGQWAPLDAVHVGMESISTEQPPPWLPAGPFQVHSLIPLIAKGDMVGILLVSPPDDPHGLEEGFNQTQKELLLDIASQMAQGIERDMLAEAQQEEAWVNTALFQVAEAVNSLIDLNEILDTIVRYVPLLVGVETCLIMTWDDEKQLFRFRSVYGVSEKGAALLTRTALAPAEFQAIKAQAEDPLAPATTAYSLDLPHWMRQVFATDTVQAFPLNARGDLVGLMAVTMDRADRPVTGRRLTILTGIAHQAATAVVNDQLYKEAAVRERLEQELDLARTIQHSLMPSGSPEIAGCSVGSLWRAARQVSGDFYDFLQFRDGRWGIVIADVADKGVPAALFMAMSRTILRSSAYGRRGPAGVLSRVNDLICQDNSSDLFVTLFYAIWDPAKSTLTYANGGHNPPLLVKNDGELLKLSTPGIALGVLPEMHFEERKLTFAPGDLLVMYTDGVTEAMNTAYDEFGLERLLHTIEAGNGQDARGIVRGIASAVSDFAGPAGQFDDITLVVLKRDAE
ncbi:MAG: SpoIIE family protein phosphatase [Anaerolineales bacterium]|nr:SpoIIE family protein phosphatase [Anaerolineales bacterium]